MTHVPIHCLSPAVGTGSARDTEDWRHRAACLGIDPETWWPTGETSVEDLTQITVAKAICARCPVADACLRWALANRIEHGVWGGLTENERSKGLTEGTMPAVTKRQPKPKPAPPVKRDPTPRTSCGRERGYQAHTNHGERHCDTCRAWRARGKKAEAA